MPLGERLVPERIGSYRDIFPTIISILPRRGWPACEPQFFLNPCPAGFRVSRVDWAKTQIVGKADDRVVPAARLECLSKISSAGVRENDMKNRGHYRSVRSIRASAFRDYPTPA